VVTLLFEQTVQEVGGTGLSSSTAISAMLGGIVGGIVGGSLAILAAFAGQLAAYVLRRSGKVLCFVAPWTESAAPDGGTLHELTLEFYNDRDVSIGITDLLFNYYKGDGSGEGWLALMVDQRTSEAIGTLTLPPHEWVRKEVRVVANPPDDFLNRNEEDDYSVITWTYPSGDEGSQRIPNHPSFDYYTGTEAEPTIFKYYLDRLLRR
jgi:hypothetical protein